MTQYCPQCGNALEANDRFCRNCGTKLQEESSARATAPLLIAVGAALLLMAVGVYALMTAGSPSAGSGADDVPFPSVERITADDAYALVQSGDAILIDVRNQAAFADAHADGALSIPEEEVPQRTNEIPRDQLIITYCT